MRDPVCCGDEMWLHCLSDVELRGGYLAVRILDETIAPADALVWECLSCDRMSLIVAIL